MPTHYFRSTDELHKWLEQLPLDWVQALAVRAALRVVPTLGVANEIWLHRFALAPIRSVAISWIARNFPSLDMDQAIYDSARDVERAYDAAASQAGATLDVFDSFLVAKHTIYSATFDLDPLERVGAVDNAMLVFATASDLDRNDSWANLRHDGAWLANAAEPKESSRLITRTKLWGVEPKKDVKRSWRDLSAKLRSIDPNYSVWIDWYERRIRGERAAFDIPGDKGRVEDKKILRRLAEATDEDFWGKGHEYVNATLKGWLDEARARVAPPIPEIDADIGVPSQEPGAIAYGVNNGGMIDRLPHSDQTQLRDLPNQRRAYADLRETALELREEGQRLGPRLQPRIERAVASLPEKFEDAEAWPVWRDFNALRRLFRAHQIAFANPEPDIAKLEPVIAETLGGLLDLFNNFAFTDDGLRAKDENRISPQERASAEAEAVAASPVIEAIRYAPSIATDLAREDIIADAENIELPVGDPYGAQVLDQANRTRRNWLAGLFEGARMALSNPIVLGTTAVIGIVAGGAEVVGSAAMTGVLASDYGVLLRFIATNSAILQNYAAIAFSSFPQLHGLIEQVSIWWKCRKQS